MTFVGWVITVVLYIFVKDCRPVKYDWIYYMKVGADYWGGFDSGLMFIRDQKSDDDYLNTHEYGHTFQNCLFGPLMLFIVVIPSAIRWWMSRYGKLPKDYDAAWFEDAATQCGKYAHEFLKTKN